MAVWPTTQNEQPWVAAAVICTASRSGSVSDARPLMAADCPIGFKRRRRVCQYAHQIGQKSIALLGSNEASPCLSGRVLDGAQGESGLGVGHDLEKTLFALNEYP